MKKLVLSISFFALALISSAQLTVFTSSNPTFCDVSSDGLAMVDSIHNGTAPYTYLWSTTGTTQSITSLSVSVYTVTVTDNIAATGVSSVTVSAGAGIGLTMADIGASCANTPDGSLTASVGGGITPYSYIWSNGYTTNGYTTATVTGLSTVGDTYYAVTVTDSQGCQVVDSTNLYHSGPWWLALSVVNETCLGGDGSISYSLGGGGVTPFVYAWSDASSNVDLSNLSAGSYSLTLSDANGCAVVDSAIVSSYQAVSAPWTVQPSGLSSPHNIIKFSIVDSANVWAITDSDGYLINTNNGGDSWVESQIQGWTGGHYISDIHATSDMNASVLVANGSANSSFLAHTNDGGTSWTLDSSVYGNSASWPNSIHFFDASKGVMMGDAESGYMEIYTTADGGTSWTRVLSGNIPTWDNTETGITMLHSAYGNSIYFGTTTGRVYRSTDSGLSWTVSDPLPGESIDKIAFKDELNGIVSSNSWGRAVTTDGGVTWNTLNQTGNLFYKWTTTNDGEYFVSYAEGQNGTGAGVSYSSNGIDWIEIDSQLGTRALNFKNKDLAWGGTLNAVSCGGIRKLAAGSIALPQCVAGGLVDFNNISCIGANDGAIQVNGIVGQTSPYTYLWEDGSTLSSKVGLSADVYQYTITSNLCFDLYAVTVNDVPVGGTNWTEQTPNFSTIREVFKFSIVDSATAWALSINNTDGQGVYAKTTDEGNTWVEGTVSGITADHYFSDFYAIDNNKAFAVFADQSNGGGFLTKTIDGGASWEIDTSVFKSASSFPAGVYFFDANAGVSFGDPVDGYFDIYTTNDGGISWSRVLQGNIPDPDTTGGTPEYGYTNKYSIVDDNIWFQTNKGRVYKSTDKGLTWSVFNVSLGENLQQIAFKDELNGIVLSHQTLFTAITDDGGETWNSFTPSSGQIHQKWTATDGYFVSYYNGFGASYSEDGYNWNTIDSAGHNAINFDGPNVAWGGTNAANNCFGIRKLDPNLLPSLNPVSAITITITSTDILCNGDSTGTASVNVLGGVTPYSYLWGNGVNGANASNLSIGSLLLTVTDNNGTQKVDSVMINQPAKVAVSITSQTNVTCFMLNDGWASAIGSGGVGELVYMWSNGKVVDTLVNLIATSYSVVAIDTNGCQSLADTIVISQPDNLMLSSFASNANCGLADGSVSVAAFGGVSPYVYNWEDGSGNSSLTNITSGGYAITVVDNSGCFAVSNAMVGDSDGPTVSILSVTEANCGGNDGEVITEVSGGQQPYTYLWSNGVNAPHLLNALAGEVSIVVIDNNGCSGTAITTITTQGTNSPSISGYVTTELSSFIVTKGKVSILMPNPYGGQFIKVGETNFDVNGYYSFDAISPIGEYTLYVEPDNSIPAYVNTIATYNGLTNKWDEAVTFNTVCDSAFKQNIIVKELDSLNGSNNLGGMVANDGTNKKAGGRAGDPIPGVDVSLEQIPGGIIAFTETGEDGRFEFPNVPVSDSSYTIYVDIPGLPMLESYEVDLSVISGIDSTIVDLDFLVSDSSIYPAAEPSAVFEMPKEERKQLFVYPNPFKGYTNITYQLEKTSNVRLEVYNLLGETILQEISSNMMAGTYNVKFNGSDYEQSSGIYFIKLSIGSEIHTARIIEIE